MAPVNGKPDPKLFDWTFVINGQPMFVKGTGWCTCDAMMDFSRARYDRLLTLAASQHIQMLRAWGSGMVETDDFYDLCDRKGIMVMQEWPTAWDSHNTQPFDMLEHTVRDGTLRLRNHPSLAIYTGGNESGNPFGKAIDMMGRLNIELDGTRDFHRGEPWGGSHHNYDVYWGGEHLDHSFSHTAVFYGEFGIASYPCYRVGAAISAGRRKKPLAGDARQKLRLSHADLQHVRGLQSADADVAVLYGRQNDGAVHRRHAIGAGRRRAACLGARPHALAGLHRRALLQAERQLPGGLVVHGRLVRRAEDFALFDSGQLRAAYGRGAVSQGDELSANRSPCRFFCWMTPTRCRAPIWEVVVRAYGADLKQIKESKFHGKGSIEKVSKLGEFTLAAEQTKTTPLFVTADVMRDGVLAKRNYYFTNFEPAKDCLFDLPKTKLAGRDSRWQVLS